MSAAIGGVLVALVLAGCTIEVDGTGGAAPGAQPPPGGPVAERPVLASARGVVAGPSGAGVEIQVDLNEVRASGLLMQVTFTARNLAPATEPALNPLPDADKWQIAGSFSDGMSAGADTADTADGVYLLDPVNGRRYLPSRTTGGACVCSSGLAASLVRPGGTEVVTATFGAPPAEVTTVDVVVPGTPAFTGVQVSR